MLVIGNKVQVANEYGMLIKGIIQSVDAKNPLNIIYVILTDKKKVIHASECEIELIKYEPEECPSIIESNKKTISVQESYIKELKNMIETLKVQNSLGIQSAINYKINHPEIINNEQEVEETQENAYNPALDVEKLKKRIATPIKQNSET
jgi:hypothetical protein